MGLALREFPQINARYDDEAGVVTRYGAVHLGIAAQTESGLMVPVLRHAETLDLWACAAEISRLAEAARAGRAAREELSGRSEEHTSELQSLMRISYAVFCLKKKNNKQ